MLIRVPETLDDGRFIVADRIGAGGMAIVHLAWDQSDARWCAAKFLAPEFVKKPAIRARFERESALMGQLGHPNVLALLASGAEDGAPWLVTELATGGSVDDWLKRNGPMPARMAVEVARQAALGLGAAHTNGVVHRDVKPENLLIHDDGTIAVMDFGIARDLGSDSFTRTGSVMGTYAFMSPEQKNGAQTDARTDIYSLGATLIALLAGYAVHEIMALVHDPQERNWIHPPIWGVLERALKLRAAERFEDGNAMAAALEAILDDLPGLLDDGPVLLDVQMELGEPPEPPDNEGPEIGYYVGEQDAPTYERVPQAPTPAPPPPPKPRPKPKRSPLIPIALGLFLLLGAGGTAGLVVVAKGSVDHAQSEHADATEQLVRLVSQNSGVVSDLQALNAPWQPAMDHMNALGTAEGHQRARHARDFVVACKSAFDALPDRDRERPEAADAARRIATLDRATDAVETAHRRWEAAAERPLGAAAIAVGLSASPPGAW